MIGSLPRSLSTFLVWETAELVKGVNGLPREVFHDSDPLNHAKLFFPELKGKLFNMDSADDPKYFDILDRYREGYVIKVAANPRVLAAYQERHPENFTYLSVWRHPADIVLNLIDRTSDGGGGWFNVLRAIGVDSEKMVNRYRASGQLTSNDKELLIQAVVESAKWLQGFPYPLNYDDLIQSGESLRDTLKECGYSFNERQDYAEGVGFQKTRLKKLQRRASAEWQELEEIARGLDPKLAQTSEND